MSPDVIDITHPVTPELPEGATYSTPEFVGVSYEVQSADAVDFDLSVRPRGAYWVALDGPTGIFGQGDSPLEAIRDFQRAAVEHLEVLDNQTALSEELQWQRSYLRERLPN